MTTGTTTVGAYPSTYYRYRQWAGEDGNHGDEHNYAYRLSESSLNAATVWKPWDTYPIWLVGGMSMFSPSIPRDYIDRTVDCVNRATIKVQAKIMDNDFKLGVFSGEFRESYHMVTGAVTSIARAIVAAKRGNWRKAFGILSLSPKEDPAGFLANSWMLYHFGISPLLSDIESAMKYMMTHYKRVKYVRAVATYKDGALIVYNNGPTSWQWSEKAIAEIRGYVDMLELSSSDRLGVTLSDIPGIAWELTKLSWIYDWLIPVGNFLEAVNAHNKTQGADFAVTRMQREMLENPTKLPGILTVKNWDSKAFQVHYGPGALNSRALMSALPFHFPTIQNPLGDNLSRWYTAMAFLRQSVGR